MICSIILRFPERHKQPENIYTNENYNEALNEFENIALDYTSNLGGALFRKITKLSELQKQPRGYYCCSAYNKLSVYSKDKNGWLYNGEIKLLREFEFIVIRIKKDYTELQTELKNRIEFFKINCGENLKAIHESLKELWI